MSNEKRAEGIVEDSKKAYEATFGEKLNDEIILRAVEDAIAKQKGEFVEKRFSLLRSLSDLFAIKSILSKPKSSSKVKSKTEKKTFLADEA